MYVSSTYQLFRSGSTAAGGYRSENGVSFVSQSRTPSIAEFDPPDQEHLRQITAWGSVVCRRRQKTTSATTVSDGVLSAVENSTAALIELLSTNTGTGSRYPRAVRSRPFGNLLPRRTQCTAFPVPPLARRIIRRQATLSGQSILARRMTEPTAGLPHLVPARYRPCCRPAASSPSTSCRTSNIRRTLPPSASRTL